VPRVHVAVFLVAACGLLAVPSAAAKDFRPGDLRVCGRHRCISITNRHLLRILSAYYYGAGRAPRAARVPLGAPGFELRFRNGYASGMVATKNLDRFRAYGFYCGRFERGRWYAFPARAAAALRRMAAGLRPLRVSAPPASC
jgi:hypothetical protein